LSPFAQFALSSVKLKILFTRFTALLIASERLCQVTSNLGKAASVLLSASTSQLTEITLLGVKLGGIYNICFVFQSNALSVLSYCVGYVDSGITEGTGAAEADGGAAKVLRCTPAPSFDLFSSSR
jgi:hypothetical protein